MNFDWTQYKPQLRTGVVVLVAIILAWALWWHYMRSPWTRDGRVRVEVIDVAAQISGQVTEVPVLDNQKVAKGDVLFVIDPRDYQYALAQAEATLKSRQADLANKQEELKRRQKLGAAAISTEDIQIAISAADVAQANLDAAKAAQDQAKLNLERTQVRSPANGYVTNLHLRVGDFATPGQTKLTVIDSDSFWIVGYFEETKLPRVHLGDYAKVELMGVGPAVEGHVESFSRGIADSNGGGLGQGLANIDPVFTWVRLAQRIPVRIHIDKVPDGVEIVAGQTCTIFLSKPRK